MIKVSTVSVYEAYTHHCTACGRVLAKDKYEDMDVVEMDHAELELCQTCSVTLYRVLGRSHARKRASH